MHKRRSKRSEIARLLALFTVFPLVIGILLAVSVMYIQGYRFNPSTREVAQGGLIQFDSHPRGATVTIDGKALTTRTAAKLDTSAGSHTITMTRDGYVPWQKTVSLNPGSVLWLSYARLIPKSIATVAQANFAKADQALAVTGQPLLYLLPDQTKPEIIQLKNNGANVKQTVITLPTSVYTAAETSTYQVVSSDRAGKNLLVRHIIGDTSELLYIDVETPARSANVTRLMGGKTIKAVEFDQTNTRQLYVLYDNSVYHFDIGDTSPGLAIASNVAEMSVNNEGTMAYVTLPDEKNAQRTVGYVTRGSALPKTVRTFYDDGTTTLHFKEAPYVNQHYFIIQYGQTLEIAAGDLPASDSTDDLSIQNIATVALLDTTGTVSMSPNNRFITVSSGATFLTYDLELTKLSTTSQRADGDNTGLAWLDDTSLLSARGDILQSYEFDGENSHKLLANAASNQTMLSSEGKYMFALQKQADGTISLIRLQLIL